MSETGIRVCFCDPKGRPYDDWDAHDGGCLMLDVAMANGKITPQGRLDRLAGYQAELGITDEEMTAEEASLATLPQDFADEVARVFDVKPLLRAWRARGLVPRVTLPDQCTRSEYGFTVHVKGACQCEGRKR